MKKKIGILTAGGDCAGLNTVIYSFTKAAQKKGFEVFGILDGTMGIMQDPPQYMALDNEKILRTYAALGGSMLGSYNRGARDPNIEGCYNNVDNFIRGKDYLGLTDIVIVGGDGSMDIVGRLCQKAKMNFIGIPKTIDNDVPLTDRCIGFSSALGECVHALRNLDTTGASHHRIMILEIMGKDTGHLALQSGIAGLADVILIPEIPYKLENMTKHLQKVLSSGTRDHALVVVAEGIKTPDGQSSIRASHAGIASYHGISGYILRMINDMVPEALARATVLGHIARGGEPNAEDRLLAMRFGAHAANLIAENKSECMVALVDGQVTDVEISKVLSAANAKELHEFSTKTITPNDPLIKVAQTLGIYVGEV